MGSVIAPVVDSRVRHRSPRRVRSPVDLMRLTVGVLLVGVGLLAAPVVDDVLTDLSSVGADAAVDLPAWVRDVPGAVLTVAVVAVAGVSLAVSLVTTRFRRLATIAVAVVVAGALSPAIGEVMEAIVDEPTRRAFDEATGPMAAWGVWTTRPTDPLLAGSVAALLVVGSFAPRGLVRALTVTVVAYGAVRVLAFGLPAVGLLPDIGAAMVAASAALLAFGRHDLAPTAPELVAGLAAIGMPVTAVERRGGDGRARWDALSADGRPLTIDVFGRDERSGDLLVRAWRWVRFRRPGDRRPFASLRRAVEHEALVSLHVAALGVRTPRLLGVAEAGRDGLALVHAAVPGASTAGDVVDDGAVRSLWAAVRTLHDHRIAHRDLRMDDVIVDEDGRAWLSGFGRSELTASDELLALDRAELLAASAAEVGADVAIDAALRSFEAEELAEALPWLQPLALSASTRSAIGGDASIADLRDRVAERCGVDAVEPVRLQRITGTNLFLVATIGVGAWVLLPQLADVDEIWTEIRSASLGWAAIAVLCSALSYVAATTALLGAVPSRLRFGPALLAQLASSFANRLTPAKVGGLATNVRYFQLQGVPPAVGIGAVGLNAAAGVVVHVLLTVMFVLLASGGGTSAGIALPSARTVLVVLSLLVALVAASAALPVARRLVVDQVWPHVRSALTSIGTIGRSPVRVMALFGGAALITLSYLGAMVASLRAFGSTASFPVVALLFLTGTAVANAAPTPGGLGAAEAALLAALSTVEDTEIVIPAVFLFRFVTFWLPILPGWFALDHLRRTGRL